MKIEKIIEVDKYLHIFKGYIVDIERETKLKYIDK